MWPQSWRARDGPLKFIVRENGRRRCGLTIRGHLTVGVDCRRPCSARPLRARNIRVFDYEAELRPIQAGVLLPNVADLGLDECRVGDNRGAAGEWLRDS